MPYYFYISNDPFDTFNQLLNGCMTYDHVKKSHWLIWRIDLRSTARKWGAFTTGQQFVPLTTCSSQCSMTGVTKVSYLVCGIVHIK